uniref:Alternative protein n=1 Tax=Macrostomum lignano TaxID=282301 RepID=A0A1I8H6W8_9PLAT
RSAYKTSPKLQSWPICRPPLCPSCPTTWPTAWARLRPASAGSPGCCCTPTRCGPSTRPSSRRSSLLSKLAPSPWRPSCRTSWPPAGHRLPQQPQLRLQPHAGGEPLPPQVLPLGGCTTGMAT